MDALRPHEQLALNMLLQGDAEPLPGLRKQAQAATVRGRKYSSFGEYVDLASPAEIPPVFPRTIVLGDVELVVKGVPLPVTALLYVTDGRINFLEFATIADDWPEAPQVESAHFLREVQAGSQTFALEAVAERHGPTLARALLGRHTDGAA